MPKFRRLKRLPLGSDDRPDRPENLPQGIEMLDFTPGFSASPETVARAEPSQEQHHAFAPREAKQGLPAPTIARISQGRVACPTVLVLRSRRSGRL